MGLVTSLYVLIVMITGVPAFFKLGWGLGLCGTLSPWLALAGGGGIAGAMRGDVGKGAWITVLIGLALIATSIWWVEQVGWHLKLGNHDVLGWIENLTGAVLGFLFGLSKRLNPPVMAASE